ncbi:Uncharacterized protein HZ326_7026 [Fusarium oxysporum f. sp. albedinis]|nr:Uncharacterized protein HZ326_7026 [Fusarium oxysporum f. sp. albedinis]
MHLSSLFSTALLFSTAIAAPQPDYSTTSAAQHGKVAKYQKQCPFSIPHVKPHNQRYEHAFNFPKGCESGKFINWKTFKANGVNLGAWLAKERTHDPVWWSSLGTKAAATIDEWGLCQALGKQCGPILEKRYESFLNTSTIDTLAKVGVNTLRITTTYAAWVKVPGSAFYHGKQQEHLRRITQYAIERYNMHIIIGLHSLPGGINNLDIGEAFGHDGWFYNSTNLAWSFKAVDKVLDFVKASGHKNAFTIAPLNEASDNLAGFGSAAGLSDKATNWILTYMNGVFQRIEAVDKRIPVMLQDNFKGAAFWSPLFDKKRNLVIDSHQSISLRRPSSPCLSVNGPCRLCTTTHYRYLIARRFLILSAMPGRSMSLVALFGQLCLTPLRLWMDKVSRGITGVMLTWSGLE